MPGANTPPQLALLPAPLLAWYGANARDLPWRREPTPYHVFVSELMLQQTRVAAVLEHYRRFMEELPTVRALAACPEDRLMKLWQGLGYYSPAHPQRGGGLHCRGRGLHCLWPGGARGRRQRAAGGLPADR